MPLPDLIEIVPLAGPVRTEITVPGSKSITNRALVLAALADGETILRGALWSEDTQVMVECLRELGFMVNVDPDAEEFCNRTITVYGLGGQVPRGGTAEQPLELFVGNAGTAARFLSAMVCLGEGVYRLHGVPRMHERPQAALFTALRELGYRVESPNDKLPALIHGGGRRAGTCTVSVAESSQFASALLLSGRTSGWMVEVTDGNEDELPYVEMTRQLCEVFPQFGGTFQIEPDASSGGYFLAADWVLWIRGPNAEMGKITVKHWPRTTWQIDSAYPTYLPKFPPILSRKIHLGDSIMMAIVKAPLNRAPQSSQNFPPPSPSATSIEFRDLGRLRVQECERVVALKTELLKCGAHVVERGDSLIVYSDADLHPPATAIETYQDHRMAMCFAILGLKVSGLRIKNPACVKKTFPNFFQKLAAPPPHGLGTEIRDAATGRVLNADELFAD